MSDLISRQAAIDAIRDMQAFEDDNGQPYLYLYDVMAVFTDEEELPPAGPKRGKWIRTGSGSLFDHYECSVCGKLPKWKCLGDNRWRIAFTEFCPNCGAKMEVNNESN